MLQDHRDVEVIVLSSFDGVGNVGQSLLIRLLSKPLVRNISELIVKVSKALRFFCHSFQRLPSQVHKASAAILIHFCFVKIDQIRAVACQAHRCVPASDDGYGPGAADKGQAGM